MSRELTSEMIAAMGQKVLRPFMMFHGQFTSGDVRLWTGLGPLELWEQTWSGVGNLIDFSPIEETDEQKASGVAVSLSGVAPSQIAIALAQVRRNYPGVLYFGLLDADGAVIEWPRVLFRGRMDVAMIEDSVTSATLKITYENEMISLERPREVRYTHEEQLRLYPGDLGLEFMAGIQDRELQWGARF